MKTDKIISLCLVLLSFLIAIWRIVTDTSDVILHWNYLGHVTDYGSRYLVLGIPCLSIGLHCVIAYFQKNPGKVNMSGVPVTESNVNFVVSYLSRLRLLCLLLLVYLTLCSCGYLPFHALVVIIAIGVIVLLFLSTKKKCIKSNNDSE